MAVKSTKGKASIKKASSKLAGGKSSTVSPATKSSLMAQATTISDTLNKMKAEKDKTTPTKKPDKLFQGSVRGADGVYSQAVGGKQNVGAAVLQSRIPKVAIPTLPAGPQSTVPSPTGPGAMQYGTGGGASMMPPGPQFTGNLMPSLQSRLGAPASKAVTATPPASSAPAAATVPTTALTREQQIANIQAEAAKIQASFEKLKKEQESKLDAAVVTDEPVVNEEETALDSISYDSPTKDALVLLEDELDRLEDIYREDKRSIAADYRVQQTNTENKQAGETGQTSVGLANAGGYLGYSGSGTGVMLTLAKGHRDELLALESERQQAVREARTASENRRFDLVREYAGEIARVDQEVYQRKQDYFKNKLELEKQEISREQKMKNESNIFEQIKAGKTSVTDIYEALGGTATVEDITNALTGFIPKSAEGGLEFSAGNTAKLIGSGMGREDIIALNEVLNEEGYTDAVRAALTPAQRYALDSILKDTPTGTGTAALGKPLSVLDIGRIEDTYGVTFPYGITQAEVTKFFEETAGMSPEEQQDQIDGVTGGGSSLTFSKDYLINNLSTKQLKTLADKTGASRFWGEGIFSGKQEDIERMLNNEDYMKKLNQMAEEARAAGYEEDAIIDHLTK